ncbi:MAG: hypothetical protein ACFCU9_11610 [Cyanophyceae cyanobacterium]
MVYTTPQAYGYGRSTAADLGSSEATETADTEKARPVEAIR